MKTPILHLLLHTHFIRSRALSILQIFFKQFMYLSLEVRSSLLYFCAQTYIHTKRDMHAHYNHLFCAEILIQISFFVQSTFWNLWCWFFEPMEWSKLHYWRQVHLNRFSLCSTRIIIAIDASLFNSSHSLRHTISTTPLHAYYTQPAMTQ